MFNKERLETLQEEEIIKLYELFFGPILMRKDSATYLQSLKQLLNKEGTIDRILEKLNTIELGILKLLSQIGRVPYPFLNEKLSILLGEHASLIGKTILNLISKNYIFRRDDDFLFIPEIISSHYSQEELVLKKTDHKKKSYRSEQFSHVINIICYFISKEIKFSKNNGLYKKDFDLLSSVYNTFTGYLRDEYDIIAHFFSRNYLYEENLRSKELKGFFSLSQLERMLFFVKNVFPYLTPIIEQVYREKTAYTVSLLDMKKIHQNLLLSFPIENEPYRADFDNILSFFIKIGLCEMDGQNIIFLYYANSETSAMEMKITSNYSIYTNSYNTDSDYYLCAIFGDIIKYDKIAEFEINDRAIRRAVHYGFDLPLFEQFILRHNAEIGLNVNTTIVEWFEKYNSFFYLEGSIFIADTIEKGHIITKLIDNGNIRIYPIKENSIFLIPPEEKQSFFDFLEKSNISFYEKKPKKEPQQEEQKKVESEILLSYISFQ